MKKIDLLLTKEAQDIINKYKDYSDNNLVFELAKQKSVPHEILMEQILAHRKAKIKFPSLYQFNLLYTKVSLEQSSGEAAAKFKASLFTGKNIIDLTGGLGIDSYYSSQRFEKVTYCELNSELYEIAKHNFKKLNATNITCFNEDSTNFLSNNNEKYDYIYIDPARRDDKRRSVDLNYCQPNIIKLKEFYFNYTNKIIVKVSPGFEIKEAVKIFKELKNIYVVSVANECKEIILELEKEYSNIPVVYAIGLKNDSEIKFNESDVFGNNRTKKLSPIKNYFYEPDLAIIKAGLSNTIAAKYDIYFLNKEVDFLTSENKIHCFPGRSFKVLVQLPFNKKTIKRYLRENNITKANISKRGFKYSVDEIRKMFNLKEGGKDYLFFTKDISGKPVFIATNRIEE